MSGKARFGHISSDDNLSCGRLLSQEHRNDLNLTQQKNKHFKNGGPSQQLSLGEQVQSN
jgi:hypothetical protein